MIDDVATDSQELPLVISLRTKPSKTDPFRTGVTIHLGRTEQDLCLIAALLSNIEVRGLQPDPLFIFQNSSQLTREALVNRIGVSRDRTDTLLRAQFSYRDSKIHSTGWSTRSLAEGQAPRIGRTCASPEETVTCKLASTN